MQTPATLNGTSATSATSASSASSGSSAAAAIAAAVQRARAGQWLLIAGGVLLGTVGVFVQQAGQHPLLTVWFRCAFGALALLLWGLASGRRAELRLPRRSYARVLASGALMVLNWGLFFAAIPRTSIAVATLVFHIQPIWVMVMGAWLLREAVSPLQWGATLLALCGLALTTGLFDALGGAGAGGAGAAAAPLLDAAWDGYGAGLLMCLGGSLCYAAVTLIAKTAHDVSAFALAWWQCLVGMLLLAWVPFVYGLPTQTAAWAWLAGLGVLHTGLAYALLFAGMARLALGRIALLQFVYPLAAVLVDWAVYGHTLAPLQLAGVALMAAALWTLRRV